MSFASSGAALVLYCSGIECERCWWIHRRIGRAGYMFYIITGYDFSHVPNIVDATIPLLHFPDRRVLESDRGAGAVPPPTRVEACFLQGTSFRDGMGHSFMS